MSLQVLDSSTGEIVFLDQAPVGMERLVELHQKVGRLIGELMDLRTLVAQQVAEELGPLQRSIAVGEFEVRINAPTTEKVDGELLRSALRDAGLGEADLDRVVRAEVSTTFKVQRAELNKLRKSDDPTLVAAVVAATEVEEQPRRLTIKRRQEVVA